MQNRAAEDAIAGPRPRPGIEAITPYKGGEAKAEGHAAPAKLSSNENPLGCSPSASAAFADCAGALALYPEGSARALRLAIGEATGLHPERIVCGAGSDELLQLLTRAYAGPGDEILFSQYGFLVYRLAAMQAGATPVAAPETGYRTDVDALLARVTPRTRILFLANPNNPTGSFLTRAEVERLHAGLPESVLLVIDAAYAEYLDREDYEPGAELAGRAPNVVMTRTFSKIYGLAGLRLGWAFGPSAIIDTLHRMRGPFNVSSPALAAGCAAIADADFATRSKAHNDRWLTFLNEEARALGVLAVESVGNFVLLKFPDEDGKRALDADQRLRAGGLITRRLEPYALTDCLRVSVGLEDANRAVIEVLRALLGAK